MIEAVTPQKLKEEMKKGTGMVIVDLQTPEQYQHSHISGAVNIPMEKFEEEYPAVLKDMNMSVVLYGEYDEMGKGTKAGEILVAKGYSQVGRIEGGLMGWKEAGFVTEGGLES